MSFFWQNPLLQNARPQCRSIGTLGDVNPVEYGGGFVFECREAGRAPSYRIEIAEVDDDDERAPATVYQVDVPDDVWEYYTPMNSGFTPERLAPTIGADPRELRRMGSSRRVMDRVGALEALAATWGWQTLDSEPITLSPAALRARWRAALRKKI